MVNSLTNSFLSRKASSILTSFKICPKFAFEISQKFFLGLRKCDSIEKKLSNFEYSVSFENKVKFFVF